MSEIDRVVVHGLRETRDGLKSLSDEAAKELTDALRAVAETVAEDARSRVPSKTGAAARSYRPRGNAKGASIAFGGPKAPYAPWLDFGGRKHGDLKGKTTGRTQPIDRPIIEGGRYLYPALHDNLEEITETVARTLNDLVDKYGIVID